MKANDRWPLHRERSIAGFERSECEGKSDGAHKQVGTCRLAGHFPAFEEAAVTWQAGQHQPDALAALVVAYDVLVHSAGRQWSFASPLDLDRRLGQHPISSISQYPRRRING